MKSICEYNPEWQKKFTLLENKIWPRVHKYADRIEHIGSTSVEGLWAKPVIDLDIVIKSKKNLGKIISTLSEIGYFHKGDLGIGGREAFGHRSPEFRHNLYVCLEGALSLRNHLTLRNHLRSDGPDRSRYSQLKKELAQRYPNNIDAYVDGKTEFIVSILEKYKFSKEDIEKVRKPNSNADFFHSLCLYHPSTQLKNAYLSALNQLEKKRDKLSWIYLGDDENTNKPHTDFNEYVRTLLKRKTKPAPGFVCNTVWWAIYKDEMVGRISIRHELNDFLKEIGGHIGFITHPKWRSKGVATWMLSEVLKTTHAKAIGKVLLTCDEHHEASEKVILRNGGVFERLVDVGPSRPPKKHFWIETE